MGAIRFYLPVSGAPPISPTPAAWSRTTGVDYILAVTTISNTALTSKVCAESDSANQNLLNRIYVTPALAAQTISGTVKSIVRSLEATTNEDGMSQLVIRAVAADGTTFRSPTLLDFVNTALSNEFVAALTNRKYPRNWSGAGASLTSCDVSANDRLVIEYGGRVLVGGEGSFSQNFGDPTAGSDCAEDETGTAANRGWIEFSELTLAAAAFMPPPPYVVRQAVKRAGYY